LYKKAFYDLMHYLLYESLDYKEACDEQKQNEKSFK
tara:strand:+ start:606 stop:713 length:108 start_codon:yes stop_codon:yes gene_type:complete